MVTRRHDDGGDLEEVHQRRLQQLQSCRRRHCVIEDIPGNDDQVHVLFPGDLADLNHHRCLHIG